MENKVRNKILQVLNHKLSEIHEVLDQIDNCDMPDCEEPGFAWCEFHPERRICSYHATPDGEDLIYFCPECYQAESSVAESIDEAINTAGPGDPPEDTYRDHIGDVDDMVEDEMISREEHERALREANTRTDKVVAHFNARDAVDYLVDEYDKDWGDTPEAKARIYVSGSNAQYRVTVERVDDADPQPTPELIGYTNLFSDGKTWSLVYPTAEWARNVAPSHAIETAVPLYRHPAPQPVYESFSTRQQDPNIREMCAKFLGVEPTETSDKTVTELVSEVILKAKRGTATAVAPKGVVERLQHLAECLKSIDKPWMASIAEAIAADVTELPPPSEWARERALLWTGTADGMLQFAAALIERAKEVES